jgi:hypothetical protein
MVSAGKFDIAQTFAVSQLREGHTKKLIEIRKKFWLDILKGNAAHSGETNGGVNAP